MSGSTSREWKVAADADGQRLDVYVGEVLSLSRAKLKALFDEGRVRVDGKKAKKGDRVQAGAQVAVSLPEEKPGLVPDASFPLAILFEDAALVAIDKPAGRPSHPLQPGEVGTVANALVARFPECADASEERREGGLCHRLDVETSGVLLAARTREAWTKLRAAFSSRDVDKRYWALVTGPLADEGEIDLPLRHHPRHPDRVEAAADGGEGAREALSRFRVLARKGEYSLVEVQILTGVLHQVRAHLAAIGASLVGDELYGGRAQPGLSRFFLHARSLTLQHPTTGERVHVESLLAKELSAALTSLGMATP